jgi:uncharacterized protein YkwD
MRRLAAILLLATACTGDIATPGGGDDDSGNDADAAPPGTPDAAPPGTPDAAAPPAPDANTGTLTDLEFCVEETNRYRAMVGKAPLAHSPALEAYATEGAEQDTLSMTAHGHFTSTGGGGIAFAENACPSWLGWSVQGSVRDTIAACIAAFWSEGPGSGPAHGHYNNMIGNYGSLGCGVYVTPQNGITIVQDYGP